MPLDAPVTTTTCSNSGLSFMAAGLLEISGVRLLNEAAGGRFARPSRGS
jgi:hypothetical protein